MLTGVRGVGKTTTARIIARALNCIGPDGAGGPTIAPCGECVHCRAIAEDRHVDVIEMDAASRTGVDDIRELIEGVRYRPVSARYKVYIIDEVHMLSKNAFNALLKTLEEPPPDVKFVFATTEIHKVPVTVLSRCQRFSLRRVPVEHAGRALSPDRRGRRRRGRAGGAGADRPRRRRLGARRAVAARPGDRAFGRRPRSRRRRCATCSASPIAGWSSTCWRRVLRGDAAGALDQMDSLYQGGADPLIVLQDLLDLSHFLTRLKLAPEAGAGDPIEEGDRERARPLAETLSMPVLARAWQMLLKGLEEVQAAPSPVQAAEMVLVRLAYVADLPAPAELVRASSRRQQRSRTAARRLARRGGPRPRAGAGTGRTHRARPPAAEPPRPATAPGPSAAAHARRVARRPTAAAATPRRAGTRRPRPSSTRAAKLCRGRRAVRQAARGADPLASDGRISIWSHFEPGRIEFRPAGAAPRDLANRLGQLLGEWTGIALARRRFGGRGRADPARAGGARDSALRNEVAATRWFGRCWRPFPGRRSPRSGSALPRPIPAPSRRRRIPATIRATTASTGEDGT